MERQWSEGDESIHQRHLLMSQKQMVTFQDEIQLHDLPQGRLAGSETNVSLTGVCRRFIQYFVPVPASSFARVCL